MTTKIDESKFHLLKVSLEAAGIASGDLLQSQLRDG